MPLNRVKTTVLVLFTLAAAGFVGLAIRSASLRHLPRYEPWERDYRWSFMPLRDDEFWPKQGELVRAEDRLLVKLARVNGPWDGEYYGQSWRVTADGTVHFTMHSGSDTGASKDPAPPEGLARLPQLLRALPLSDSAVRSEDRILVAFPVGGRYVVRTYDRSAVPTEVEAIARAIKATMY